MNKKTLYISLVTVLAASVLGIASNRSATQAVVVPGKLCDLEIFPYNPDASQNTYGSAVNPYKNELSQTECYEHLTYPNAYQPQPPLAIDPRTDGAARTRVFQRFASHGSGGFLLQILRG